MTFIPLKGTTILITINKNLVYILRTLISVFIKITFRYIKNLYRNVKTNLQIEKLKKNKVIVNSSVLFSQNTQFEQNIKIGRNTDIRNSNIGSGTYIRDNCVLPSCKVGRFCSIGDNVKAVIGNHPTHTFVSTHPAFFSTFNQAGFKFAKQSMFDELKYADAENNYFVSIGNDVWIGEDVMIMQGITIGDGAIIGTGSIVTKNILPYSINLGIPSKPKSYRFSEEQIEKLLQIKWWNWKFEKIEENSSLFTNINEFLKNIEA